MNAEHVNALISTNVISLLRLRGWRSADLAREIKARQLEKGPSSSHLSDLLRWAETDSPERPRNWTVQAMANVSSVLGVEIYTLLLPPEQAPRSAPWHGQKWPEKAAELVFHKGWIGGMQAMLAFTAEALADEAAPTRHK